MASFDFIDATNKGYGFLWRHRALVAKLAFFPIFVKFICLVTIMNLGYEDNILRSGLLLLPSYFLEGWLLANLLRIAFFSDVGATLTGNPAQDEEAIKARSRDLMAGVLVYVLLKLTGMFVIGISGVQPGVVPEQEAQNDPSFFMFVVAFSLMVAFIWLFRVYFLYIPVTLGYRMKTYFKKLRGFRSSFVMIATWFMCFLPLLLLLILGYDLLNILFGGMSDSGGGFAFKFVGLIWRSIIEVTMEVLITITMAYGIIAMLNDTEIDGSQSKGDQTKS